MSLKMKTLILLRGVQGCGKTSFATLIANALGAPMFAADDWFYKDDGSYEFVLEDLGRAHAKCKSNVEIAMGDEVEVIIVHNTFGTNKEIRPYAKMAEDHGYRLVSLVVENRHGNKDLHNVPQEVREAMADKIKNSIKLV
jgi:predicted kinase